MFPAVRLGKTAVSTLPPSAHGVGEGTGDGDGGGRVAEIVGIGVSVASMSGVGGGGSVASGAWVGSGAEGDAQVVRRKVVRKTAVHCQNLINQCPTANGLPFTD